MSGGPILKVPDAVTLLNPGAYLYFLQGGVQNESSFFFSSSGVAFIALTKHDGLPDLVNVQRIPLDSWLIDRRLVSQKQVFGLGELTDVAKSAVSVYKETLLRHGWIDRKSFIQSGHFNADYFWYPQGDHQEVERMAYQKFDAVFASEEGKAFLGVYDQCSLSTCGYEEIRAAARRYYSVASQRKYVGFDEYVLVAMLSGAPPPKPFPRIKTDRISRFHDCGRGVFYEGFGVQALVTSNWAFGR